MGTSKTRTGWTIGGGVEWMFAPQWSAFLEGNYMDFGSKKDGTLDPVLTGCVACAFSVKATEAIVLVGVDSVGEKGRTNTHPPSTRTDKTPSSARGLLRLIKRRPVSVTPIAVIRAIGISPVPNGRMSAAHRLAVTVAAPRRVGAEVRKALRE